MPRERLALGLDSSTQSLSAVVIDIDTAEKCFEHSLDYRADARLNHFGIGEDYILPPREEGEAEQPPLMYLASLDALFADMREAGIPLENIRLINTSGQQHGHVYLNRDADALLAQLTRRGAVTSSLQTLLKDAFAYPNAPIWMTANTTAQTEAVRNGVGGKSEMIDLSGSDAPLRFTGAVVRRVGEQFPECYTATAKVQLISSFIPAVLTGNADVPIDYGNGCGMSLMNYRGKVWDPALLAATAEGLPGGVEGTPIQITCARTSRFHRGQSRRVLRREVWLRWSLCRDRRFRRQSAVEGPRCRRFAESRNQFRQHGVNRRGYTRPRGIRQRHV